MDHPTPHTDPTDPLSVPSNQPEDPRQDAAGKPDLAVRTEWTMVRVQPKGWWRR